MEIVLLPILLTSNRYLQTRHRLPTRKTYSESTIKARFLPKQEKRSQSNLNLVSILGLEEIFNHSANEKVKIIINHKTYQILQQDFSISFYFQFMTLLKIAIDCQMKIFFVIWLVLESYAIVTHIIHSVSKYKKLPSCGRVSTKHFIMRYHYIKN